MLGLVADALPAGPGLAAWVAQCPPAQLPDVDLPAVAAALRRVTSWAQAAELAVVAQIAARSAARDPHAGLGDDGRPAAVTRDAAAQAGLALTLSPGAASWWTDLAVTLGWRLPATAAALSAGQIDLARARIIAEATAVLSDDTARAAEAQVLPAAGGQTYGQLRAAAARSVILADPQGAEERRQATERRARVGLYPGDHHTATLTGMNLPAVHAAAAMARLTALARAMQAAGAGGGIDLLRSHAYLGLLLNTLPLIPPRPDAPPDTPPEGPDDPGPGGPGPGGPGPGDGPGPAGRTTAARVTASWTMTARPTPTAPGGRRRLRAAGPAAAAAATPARRPGPAPPAPGAAAAPTASPPRTTAPRTTRPRTRQRQPGPATSLGVRAALIRAQTGPARERRTARTRRDDIRAGRTPARPAIHLTGPTRPRLHPLAVLPPPGPRPARAQAGTGSAAAEARSDRLPPEGWPADTDAPADDGVREPSPEVPDGYADDGGYPDYDLYDEPADPSPIPAWPHIPATTSAPGPAPTAAPGLAAAAFRHSPGLAPEADQDAGAPRPDCSS